MLLVSPITKTDKLVFHMAGSMRNCLRCHHLVWIMTTSTSQTAPQSETLMFLPTHWIRHADDVFHVLFTALWASRISPQRFR